MVGWRGVGRNWRGLLAAVLLSSPALAQEPEAETGTDSETPVVTPAAPAVSTEAPAKKKKKKKTEPLGENPDADDESSDDEKDERKLRLFGRVFARASADERDEYARALSVPSARVGVNTEFQYVEAEVSADLSSKTILKDAFVRLADGHKRLRLYAGQFKAPFLARELESTWDLPLLERGLVTDYLTDTNQLGGRRLGLMGEVKLKDAWNLKLSGGMFAGGKDELGNRTSEDASARVTVRPFKALTVGASTYLTQVTEGTKNYALATDGTLHLGGLALTGEAVTGHLGLGPFTAQLGLASYLLKLDKNWALQPLAGAEALQLRGDVAGRGWSAVGGVNVLFLDAFKAQLQAERALRPGDETPGTEFSLQLATRF